MNPATQVNDVRRSASTSKPLVTVGLPVYNGEDYLAEAIDDVLQQTLEDFELVISDNGSTDRTQEICEEFARNDGRVRYLRSPENRGAGWNFNEVLRVARGRYFKWLAHDDRMDVAFLELCVDALESNRGVVLAYPQTIVFSDDDDTVLEYGVRLRSDSPDPNTRFADLVLSWSMCYEVFGLMRTDAVRKAGGMGNFSHGDGVLLARLGLLGPFVEIPRQMHRSRKHAGQSMQQFGLSEAGGNDYHRYAVWFNPRAANRLMFPTWRIGSELYRSIWAYSLSPAARVRAHGTMIWWARRNVRHLIGDLRYAAGKAPAMLVRRLRRRG